MWNRRFTFWMHWPQSPIFGPQRLAAYGAALVLWTALAPLHAAAAGVDESTANPPAADSSTTADSGAPAPPTKADIHVLIRELGSPRFAARRAAANELRRIGPDAFDALFLASENPDPEIASSAHYLLREISVRWVHSDDPAAVRRILRKYGEASDESRSSDLLALALLPDREGLAALCRIARYDRSPLVSRKAALAVIWPDLPSARRSPIDPDVIESELGESTRTAVTWLRQLQAQLRDPAAAVNAWQRLIDEESARVSQNSDETSVEVLTGLMWNLADVYHRLENQSALTQIVDRMVRQDGENPDETAVVLLMWLVDVESWTSVDDLLTRHAARFSQGKRPLYAVAIAREKQGKKELAESFAEQAAKLDASEPLGSFEMAKDLEYRGLFDWAVREYRREIEDQPVASHESIVARVSLASLLHDYEKQQEAADVLAPLVRATADPKTAQLYDQVRSFMASRYGIGLWERKGLAAQYHFYLACHHRAAEDWKRERDELDLAIRFDREDADVLIAMYRLPNADEAWLADVRKKIAALAGTFQKQIDDAPTQASNYNQWAWLISNTEGDFQKAIEYSHKSLELNTFGESASASYLDTLGRCYYAAGDYENAVKYQRQAVEKVSYLQVMRRQLDLFEKALAEKNARSDTSP